MLRARGAPKKARLNFSTKGKLYSSGMEYYESTASANTKLNWVRMRTANSRFFVRFLQSKSNCGWVFAGWHCKPTLPLVPFGIKCSLDLPQFLKILRKKNRYRLLD